MSADLHIHIFKKVKEKDLAHFFSNTIGSKWCSWDLEDIQCDIFTCKKCQRVKRTPNEWIGSVSWLKAALFEEGRERYIPDTVQEINELVGEELPVLDEKLKIEILKAFDLGNATRYDLADKDEVEEFLNKYMGEKLFTVSW